VIDKKSIVALGVADSYHKFDKFPLPKLAVTNDEEIELQLKVPKSQHSNIPNYNFICGVWTFFICFLILITRGLKTSRSKCPYSKYITL
jgi:hypothetical protein